MYKNVCLYRFGQRYWSDQMEKHELLRMFPVRRELHTKGNLFSFLFWYWILLNASIWNIKIIVLKVSSFWTNGQNHFLKIFQLLSKFTHIQISMYMLGVNVFLKSPWTICTIHLQQEICMRSTLFSRFIKGRFVSKTNIETCHIAYKTIPKLLNN